MARPKGKMGSSIPLYKQYPSREVLLNDLNTMKAYEVCDKYNVSISIINCWKKELNIKWAKRYE